MKATGIVRRIDDLGRVVIPKEIRRLMRIKEGDALEVFINSTNTEVTYKKYSPIKELRDVAAPFIKTITNNTNYIIIVTDREQVATVSGMKLTEILDKQISSEISRIILNKYPEVIKENTPILNLNKDILLIYKEGYIHPIKADGEVIGTIILLLKDKELTETEKTIAKIAADFIGNQLSVDTY